MRNKVQMTAAHENFGVGTRGRFFLVVRGGGNIYKAVLLIKVCPFVTE